MQSRFRSTLQFAGQQFFYLEQWAALLLGIVCLGVSVWATFSDSAATVARPHIGAVGVAFSTAKGFLTFVVALLGIVLVRFAFYKPRESNADTGATSVERRFPQAKLRKSAPAEQPMTNRRRG